MLDLKSIIRQDLQLFVGYSSSRDEAKTGLVWLNANESPWETVAHDFTCQHRYPEKQPAFLSEEAARYFKINKKNMLITRGSDEGIDLLIRLCCQVGDGIMICPPTFGMYEVAAKLQGANIFEVPLIKEKNFILNKKSILNFNYPVKLIFLCSPNNPTGNSFSMEDIIEICKFYHNKSLIIVDEAYIEFSNNPSLISYIETIPNLVVLRTFSKAFGLASARLGFVFANEKLINYLLKIIAPYPISETSAYLGMEALKKYKKIIKGNIDLIKKERSEMISFLEELSYVDKVYPSESNFILIKTFLAEKLMGFLIKQKIIVRAMYHKPYLENCLRITIGSPEENEILKIKLLIFNKDYENIYV